MPRDNSTGNFYSTNGAPRGSRKCDIQRLNAPPNGSGAATTIFANALFENFEIRRAAAGMANQNGINAQDKDWSGARGEVTATATVQIPSTTTKSINQGDFLEDSFEIDAAGAATANERFVVIDYGNPEVQGDCIKQTLTLRLDRRNSARWASEFA